MLSDDIFAELPEYDMCQAAKIVEDYCKFYKCMSLERHVTHSKLSGLVDSTYVKVHVKKDERTTYEIYARFFNSNCELTIILHRSYFGTAILFIITIRSKTFKNYRDLCVYLIDFLRKRIKSFNI